MKAKHQTPPCILRLREAFSALKKRRPVQVWELNLMGYLASGTILELQTMAGRPNLHLVEIVEAETGKEAGFSYLWHLKKEEGYILPYPYSYFIDDEPESFTGELQPA